MPKLAIVIPCWNNWKYTKNAVKMLNPLKDTTILVVDNGSTDLTKNMVSEGNVEVIHLQENLGFAKGCGYGFEYTASTHENIMFLNNDIKVINDFETWIGPLVEAAQQGKIVGPTVGCLDDNLNFICEASKWPSKGHAYLSGWNITASTETWQKLVLDGERGPFSSEYGKAYFEDTDLGFRAKQLGIPAEIVPVPVRHFGKATSKNIGINDLYLNAKSIFLKKWKGNI